MLKYILVCILAMSGYYAWTIYPINHGPGVITPDEPSITYSAWDKPFNYKGNTIEPLKNYQATTRVLKNRRYFLDDKHDLAPIDILVGWDEMSDERNLKFIQFSLSDRNFELNFTKPPIPEARIYNQMEFLHLIPSTKEIEKTINWLRTGAIVSIEGKIVNIQSNTDFDWNSEIRLTDNAETKKLIIWVESIQVQ